MEYSQRRGFESLVLVQGWIISRKYNHQKRKLLTRGVSVQPWRKSERNQHPKYKRSCKNFNNNNLNKNVVIYQ